MNLPRELGDRLARHEHQYRHVGDLGFATATDESIVTVARAAAEVILTHDLDYGDILAFSGRTQPSVVIFRLRNSSVNNLAARFFGCWGDIHQPLIDGAIVVIEDGGYRIRRLPVREGA